MNSKLQALTTEELVYLLNQERKKFILALDYGATGSDLEEIRDKIRELETIISSRQTARDKRVKPESRQSSYV